MSFHLQKNKKNRYKSLFAADNGFWEYIKKFETEGTYKDTPLWFWLVFKRFCNRLNWPFGSVSTLPQLFIKKLIEEMTDEVQSKAYTVSFFL